MSPDELVDRLSEIGANITRRTLFNYETWQLIPAAERGGGGTGGRWTNYPTDTLSEAYASFCLLHGSYINTQELPSELDHLSGLKFPKVSPELVRMVRGRVNNGGGSLQQKIDLLLQQATKEASSEDFSYEDKAKIGEAVIALYVDHKFGAFLDNDRAGERMPEELASLVDFLADIWTQKKSEGLEKLLTLQEQKKVD